MLKLILPVIFPSWRFFSGIGPSPRIQFTFLQNLNDKSSDWREFRVKPQRVSFWEGLRRLFFNPQWNETLYMNTCAECLFDEYSLMREQEIMKRLCLAIDSGEIARELGLNYFQYRICAVVRDGKLISQSVFFTSKPVLLTSILNLSDSLEGVA